jgi:hypothetical protein
MVVVTGGNKDREIQVFMGGKEDRIHNGKLATHREIKLIRGLKANRSQVSYFWNWKLQI